MNIVAFKMVNISQSPLFQTKFTHYRRNEHSRMRVKNNSIFVVYFTIQKSTQAYLLAFRLIT